MKLQVKAHLRRLRRRHSARQVFPRLRCFQNGLVRAKQPHHPAVPGHDQLRGGHSAHNRHHPAEVGDSGADFDKHLGFAHAALPSIRESVSTGLFDSPFRQTMDKLYYLSQTAGMEWEFS
jgi:hypothetical protein